MTGQYVKTDTLCWTCINAVPDAAGKRGCSWSRENKPVRGWQAQPTAGSYVVRSCPAYQPDTPQKDKPQKDKPAGLTTPTLKMRLGAVLRRMRRTVYPQARRTVRPQARKVREAYICGRCWPRFQAGFPSARRMENAPHMVCKCEMCGGKRMCALTERTARERMA